MGFTGSQALATEVRRARDSVLAQGDFRLRWRRMVELHLRTAAHYPQSIRCQKVARAVAGGRARRASRGWISTVVVR